MKNKTSEFKEPIDMLIVPDYPNECPFDGARTELLETRDEYLIEQCLHCKKLFNFWIE